MSIQDTTRQIQDKINNLFSFGKPRSQTRQVIVVRPQGYQPSYNQNNRHLPPPPPPPPTRNQNQNQRYQPPPPPPTRNHPPPPVSNPNLQNQNQGPYSPTNQQEIINQSHRAGLYKNDSELLKNTQTKESTQGQEQIVVDQKQWPLWKRLLKTFLLTTVPSSLDHIFFIDIALLSVLSSEEEEEGYNIILATCLGLGLFLNLSFIIYLYCKAYGSQLACLSYLAIPFLIFIAWFRIWDLIIILMENVENKTNRQLWIIEMWDYWEPRYSVLQFFLCITQLIALTWQGISQGGLQTNSILQIVFIIVNMILTLAQQVYWARQKRHKRKALQQKKAQEDANTTRTVQLTTVP